MLKGNANALGEGSSGNAASATTKSTEAKSAASTELVNLRMKAGTIQLDGRPQQPASLNFQISFRSAATAFATMIAQKYFRGLRSIEGLIAVHRVLSSAVSRDAAAALCGLRWRAAAKLDFSASVARLSAAKLADTWEVGTCRRFPATLEPTAHADAGRRFCGLRVPSAVPSSTKRAGKAVQEALKGLDRHLLPTAEWTALGAATAEPGRLLRGPALESNSCIALQALFGARGATAPTLELLRRARTKAALEMVPWPPRSSCWKTSFNASKVSGLSAKLSSETPTLLLQPLCPTARTALLTCAPALPSIAPPVAGWEATRELARATPLPT
mmetsp:Transcript_35926/g.84091  ORF Transcript_35926/g.84091 Transcript_35926/m.84091 type:complete len:330 (+) Transcript_35926:65-1054(+)